MAGLLVPVFAVCLLGLRNPDGGGRCDLVCGVIVDTPICVPHEVSRSVFFDNVAQRLSRVHLPADSLRDRGNDYTIVFYRYDRPNAKYMLLKITADSSGSALHYEIRQNFDTSVGSTGNGKLKIGWLKKMRFRGLYDRYGYTVNNCYVTDGSDVVIFISRHDETINGIAVEGGPDEEKAIAPYALLLKNCNNTFDKFLKRL